MLRHNFLLLYRNFKRFRGTFFINLAGLSTGLACTLLIYLWVYDEWQVDKFHANDSWLYKIFEKQQHSGNIGVTDSTPGLLAETLAEDMPEVEYASTVTPPYWFDRFTLSVKDKRISAAGIYAGKDYFNIFSFDLLHGDASRVLADKNSIVISESIAKSLFTTTANAMGKAIEWQREQEYIVSGVFKDIPSASSLRSDFVLSFEVMKDTNKGVLNWANSGPMTFLVLKKGTDATLFERKISGLIKTKTTATHRDLILQKYSDGYLFGRFENGIATGGRIDYVILFSVIAAFILVIACINFMNLSTAKASRRLKEIGIKKAIGAGRRTLVIQHLGESMFMSFLSLLLAVLMVDLVLPSFNIITVKQLVLTFSTDLVVASLLITLAAGLLAGSYPALYLSGFSPVHVLKGKLNSSTGELWARKGLVIFQFTLSVIFIVSVLIIYMQIDFLQSRNLGYNKDNVIHFPMEGRVKENPETFLNELRKLPGIVSASSIGQSMVGGGNTTEIEWEGKEPNMLVPFAIRPVNYDVIEMLDLELLQGRAFSRDDSPGFKAIFNETAIDIMALKDPIGKTIQLGNDKLNVEIIGVVKDFHFESLHSKVAPMFFVIAPPYTSKIIARMTAGSERETIDRLQNFYRTYNPEFDLDYRFLDQDYQAQYAAEERIGTLSEYFAGLAILISCLGLFGLASFTAERRLKEIGIRKVLGSSATNIVILLTADFTRIVLVAIILALPVSYYIGKFWLDNFAYKIPLTWWYFVSGGCIALFISWLTVGLQAIRAARVNPARCLRDE
ncbi:ABC transporter permease [Ohtaekwangia kribbensis]|uniref:ABC transporter permease n=1 Tax=Ohtaekwangia kribbensis TaxID=688913 RepID=A0ABW3K0C2_9BACT